MEELRPKVLALYQAVLDLLDEEADINTLKVSDITNRAGIGKGTAYEYFKSKEEIIAGAILYDVEQRVKTETERLDAYEGFENKIRYSFDWILHHCQEQKAFSRFLRLTTQPCEIRGTLMEKIRRKNPADCGPMVILGRICGEGKAEGAIREEIPVSAAALLALANMTSFVMYLENRRQFPDRPADLEPEAMKEFLCEGLLGQLRRE